MAYEPENPHNPK